MDDFTHNLLHLIADMIRIMQEYEKKITELIDKKIKEDESSSRGND